MYAAVEQLFVVQVHLLCLFAGFFGDAGHGFAVPFAFLHLLQDYVGHLKVAVKIVVKLLFDEVAYELCYGWAVGSHVARPEFGFCLRFEHGFLHFYGHCGDYAVADVGVFKVTSEKIFQSARHRFLESA